jgi:P-type Mg2+ transporter
LAAEPTVTLEQRTSEQGLSSEEARRRLTEVGPNEPAPERQAALLAQVLALFTNPLVAILLLASVVSALLGELINAAIIVAILLSSAALNFIQTYRSRRAAERLRQEVAPTATVCRDGRWVTLPRKEVVPGDLIRLLAGDLVPADARLLATQDLHVQQAALTGESLPVEKEAAEPAPAGLPGVERPAGEAQQVAAEDAAARSTVFLGTSVVSGTGTARVTATGRATAFGDIAARLRTAGNPLRSRPSVPLTATTLLIVLIGIALPFSPLAAPLGFAPLPGPFFGFLAGMTITYLLLVELVKRRLMRRVLT